VRRTGFGFGLVVPALACALASCGGSAPSDLFSSPADSGAFDVSARDQGLPLDTGVQPAADAADDTGIVVDATPQPAPEAAAPEAAVIDAGLPPYSIDCGGTTMCSGPAQTCCVSGAPGAQDDTCVADANSCNGPLTTPVSCSSSSQCPAGEICCGREPNGTYTDVSCRSTCDGTTEFVFCDPNVPNDCPPGMMCGPSTLLDGFNRCG
jgi:hypothetical protein